MAIIKVNNTYYNVHYGFIKLVELFIDTSEDKYEIRKSYSKNVFSGIKIIKKQMPIKKQ